MNKTVALIAALLAITPAGCAFSPDTSGASPQPSSSAPASPTTGTPPAQLYVCAVMPGVDKTTIPLLAEGKQGGRVVGLLPASEMQLGCELGDPDDAYVHIVAPRSYIRHKAGVESGWGSAEDVLFLANLDTREPTVYTGPR